MTPSRKKLDIMIALLLAVIVFIGTCLFCDNTQYWGDDYAAYILEGRAIATGTIDRQLQDNLFLHPSAIFGTDVSKMSQLTYAWGYPMLMAIVYRFVGFDRSVPMHIFYYKLPGISALALFSAVLYFFYRRRFQSLYAFILSVFMVLSIVTFADRIQTDLVFLLFTYLCFYCFEEFRDLRPDQKNLWAGIGLGGAMWFAYELRPNGFTVILLVILMHLWHLYRTKPSREKWIPHLIPYLTLAVLWALTRAVLPSPTSSMADIGLGSLSDGLRYYTDMINGWIYELSPFGGTPLRRLISYGLRFCLITGLIRKGPREAFPYAAFLAATILVNASLPYDQGLRYIFNILPLFLLFIGHGMDFIYQFLYGYIKNTKLQKAFAVLAAVLIIGYSFIETNAQLRLLHTVREDKASLQTNAQENAFAESCLDVYDYIATQTEADAVIAFMKPRVLYLSTDRMAFNPFVNGHSLEEGDYFLQLHDPTRWDPEELTPEQREHLTSVYANDDFTLYKLVKENR